jgi:glycosyltransferase involved in cell wall biosynthesis
MVRTRSVQERDKLERLRGDRDVCWPEEAANAPLVSVVIPTYSRGRILVERSLASVLSQTYQNLDVVVVGDHATDETIEAIRAVDDPRVRFEDLQVRSPYPSDPEKAWQCVGSRPFNRGLELARGSWIAPHADDDEFTPDHVATLLAVATEHRLELVYGDSWMETADGTWLRLGTWPPAHGGFCAGAVLYAAPLRYMKMDEDCWRENEPNDWDLWRRMLAAGVRAGHIDEVVFRHYVEARHRPLVAASAI